MQERDVVHMIKFKYFLLIGSIFIGFSSFAAPVEEDYEPTYQEDEGRLLFKLRGYGIRSDGKQKKLPAPTASSPKSNGSLIQNGFGADAASAIFFNDNLATELSIGFNLLRVKSSTISNIGYNYSGTNPSLGKRRDVYSIPLSFIPQYHLAPFGAIRPYLGIGYHYSCLFTKSKHIKVKNGHGAVVQAGADFVAKDDTLITVDIRQYWLEPTFTYKSSLFNGMQPNGVKSKIKINPLIIAVGIGFKF